MAAAVLRVDVVGCGGIGGHLAPNLCHLLHAERRAAHVTLVDGDAFEPRNRSRMRFRSAHENKAVALARDLADAFGDLLSFAPVPEYLTRDNAPSLLRDGDHVILAVDNHATRLLADEHCGRLDDVVLVSGGNDGVEDGADGTHGSVQIRRREGGRDRTHALARFHPEIASPADRHPGELGCEVLAQQGATQLLVTNVAVAAAMLAAYYGVLRGWASYEEVYLDVRRNRSASIERPLADPT
jgi:hypothetical protein